MRSEYQGADIFGERERRQVRTRSGVLELDHDLFPSPERCGVSDPDSCPRTERTENQCYHIIKKLCLRFISPSALLS